MMISPTYRILNKKSLLAATSAFPELLQARHPESHKGTHGTLAVIGGASGMSGAVVLAATAAIYQGCGKVWAGFCQPALPFPIMPERPEIMLATAADLAQRADISAWALGCGMGQSEQAAALLAQVLAKRSEALLLDADALNLLAQSPALQQAAAQHGRLVLTPHPTEAARLLACHTEDIQSDRPAAAAELSRRFQAVAVLKGRHTLTTAPDGRLHTNPSGNAGLATAGSGDVLSGIIGSLLAQGLPPLAAARAGVWLHGAAADLLRDNGIGEVGMLAGELAPAARWLRNRLIEWHIQSQTDNRPFEKWV